jgi:hypothetical protein
MSRLFLIEDLIKKNVKDHGKEYKVKRLIESGDNRGSKTIKLKSIQALSQPTSEKERMRLPEGDKIKESRFYAMFGSSFVEEGNVIEETLNGETVDFEIKAIQRWTNSMKAIGVKIR